MIKLNRTTEYGLMALSYIRNKSGGGLASAREISQHFDLPFEILAKTLQKLKEQGIISSSYGTRGGYLLARDLKTLNLAQFLEMIEGPSGVVSCVSLDPKKERVAPVTASSDKNACCEYSMHCSIKGMMGVLNGKIYDFLTRITIDELTGAVGATQCGTLLTSPAANVDKQNSYTSALLQQGEEP